MNRKFPNQNLVLIEEFLIDNVKNILEEQNFLQYSLNPEEIKQILMRSSDYFNNADLAVEFIIKSNDYFFNDKSSSSFFSFSEISINNLQQMLSKSCYLAENRNIQIDDQNENNFSIKKYSENSDEIVFAHSVLIMIIRSEFGKEMSNNIDKFINEFNEYSVQSNFSPINANLIKKIDEKIDTDFSLFAGIPSGSSDIFQKGIVSNGHFLFVLHSDYYLSIFPISMENGGFLSPIMCKLNVDSNNNNNNRNVSLSFLSEKLVVTTQQNHLFFDINKLIHDQTKVPEIQNEEQFSNNKNVVSIVSDGVVNVILYKEKEFVIATVKTVDSKRKVSKVALHKNEDEKMYETYHLNDYMNLLSCPSETNGIVLSFYMKIDQNHILVRHFSLIDGCHLKDDLLETNINISAITYDSINQMHYVVVDNNGQLIVYALNGSSSSSVNPSIFGFIISDDEHNLDGKSKKFSLFSKNPQSNEILKGRVFTFLFSSILLSSIFFKKDVDTFIFLEMNGTLTIPIFIVEIAESLINSDKDEIMNNIKLTSLQILSILFVINVRHQFMNSNEEYQELEIFKKRFQSIVIDMLLKLSKIDGPFITSIISFIFLHLFDLIDLIDNNYQAILEGLLISATPSLSKYIIHVLFYNSAQSSLISFSDSVFIKYIINNFVLSKVHPNILSFLLCHQRCIINQLHYSLQKEHFSTASLIIDINFNDCKTDNEALNIFGEYTNFLINQFSSSIINSSSFEEFQKTTIYFLFSNYLSLIIGLYNFHEAAQIVTPLLHITQNSLKNFFDQKKIVVSDNEEARKILTRIGLAFGAFTGTLIKGGNYSMFDDKYKWLIRPNMNLIEHPNLLHELDNPSSNVDTYIDENVRQFLSSEDGKKILQTIYKKWNYNMNKNLNYPFLELDQLFLAVELYHLQLFDELKEMNINKLKPALQQMMRVRNSARLILRSNNPTRSIQILQDDNKANEENDNNGKKKRHKSDSNELNSYYSPFDLIVIKCKMLLRLTSKFDNTNISIAPKLLADFVLSSDQPNTFINYISNQRNRLQLTNIGFSLIEASYSLKIDEFFIQIIDAILSIAVDNFDGLSAIIRYDNLHKSEKYISNFLLKSLKSIEYPYLSLISHKLIKSDVLSKDVLGNIFEEFVPYALNDHKLFCIFYKKFGYINNMLTNSEKFLFYDSKVDKKVPFISLSLTDFDKITENQWYIISEVFSVQTIDPELYHKIFNFFMKFDFNCQLDNVNSLFFISECIFGFYQNCGEFYTHQKIKEDFLNMLKILGKSLITSNNLERASSIVTIFRKILAQSNKISMVLIDLFNSYESSLRKIDVYKTKDYYEIICAIFATLGGFIDIILPYNPISFRLNRESIHQGILINKNKIIELPVNEETKIIKTNDYNVYPEPLIPFNCSMFTNYQFIKSFLKYSLKDLTKKVAFLYLNSLSFYLKEEDFIKLISDDDANYLISKLSCIMNPFDTMKDNQRIISFLLSLKKTKCFKDCKFSIMSNDSIKCTTYLSPILKPLKAKVVVQANQEFEGYFGLVADCPLEKQYPYVIIHSKLGIIYPGSIGKIDKKLENKKSNTISFSVDISKQVIILNEESAKNKVLIEIPPIENKTIKYRIYLCVFDSCKVKSIQVFSSESEPFQFDYSPEPFSIYNQTKTNELVKFPLSINLMSDSQLKEFSNKSKLIPFTPVANMEFNEKPLFEMVNIKNLLFNFMQADTISDDLANSIVSHIYSKLITQISTVIMMELVNNGFGILFKPIYLIKLFSYLQIPLEYYDHEKMINKEFPFEFNKSILEENSLKTPNQQFDNLEFDMKKCLNIISRINNSKDKKPSQFFIDELKSYIEDMFNDPYVHTLRNLSLNVHFYDLTYLHYYIILSVPEDAESIIISVPYLNNFNVNEVTKYVLSQNTTIDFPVIYDNSNEIMIGIQQIKTFYNGLCTLSINKYNNNWVFGTPYELLLLLKEFYFNSKEPLFFREILIDLILINSPFVSMFVSKLLIQYGQDCFFSPSQFKMNYLKILYLLSSLTKAYPNFVDKNMNLFISHENRSLNFPFLSKLAPFFPEFHQSSFIFEEKDPKMKIQIKLNKLNIPENILDPLDEFMTCLSIINDDESIKSHYIDNLLIWLSISVFNLKENISNDGIFSIRNKDEYNCEFLPSKIHDIFLNEIEMIKNQWPKEKISLFASTIPSNILKSNDFDQLCMYTLSNDSEFKSESSPRILLLIAYVIHRVNYLYENHNFEIPNDILTNTIYLLPFNETGNSFLESITNIEIPPVLLFVDRFEAHRISVEGNGKQSMSIICQVSRFIAKHPLVFKQAETMPWIVHFINERAIDCGGPSRELFTEISMSIFEPTTGLFIISPNGRNKCGSSNREVYIPFHSAPTNKKLIETKLQERMDCYETIGIFIGIIIRLGYYQDLPFAPIVWKAIAGEQINENDIFVIDQRFHEFIDNLRKAKNDISLFNSLPQPINWNCENWDGSIVQINNPTKSKVVRFEHIDIYISYCIKKRIELLHESTMLIRNGFCANIGFNKHKFMCGHLISFLAQGSSSISTNELKKISILISPHCQTYDFFWEAVEMMTNKERSLLLKFITGLTKLPKNDKSFLIKIDIRTDLIDYLPTASTCFYILGLPIYSSKQVAYDMLKIAIESCQTMENA